MSDGVNDGFQGAFGAAGGCGLVMFLLIGFLMFLGFINSVLFPETPKVDRPDLTPRTSKVIKEKVKHEHCRD